MAQLNLILVSLLFLTLFLHSRPTHAQLSRHHYKNSCPNVENIVREAVKKKFHQTFTTVPATLRLFFHDCFVQGCDGSILVSSTPHNRAERDHPDNLSLAGDGFDTVIQAKAAVDAVPLCQNKVSCADILAMATRDVIALAGGPYYEVELGRFDGLRSKDSDVNGKLPEPGFNLNQLNTLFKHHGLTQTEMIALSGAHTVGFSHCNKFTNRVYNFKTTSRVDPTLDLKYAAQLKSMCPRNVDPRVAVDMDPVTPHAFDNVYFKNLQKGKGLFTSDQVLFTDSRSKAAVNAFASSNKIFHANFVAAMTKLGRVGVKNSHNGNIRTDCSVI
ncbi:putative peroxidase [Medicago truncatula]|uniref:Peroxidase n=1 Tax=Medicago truncatula TaxID=3880 RepID=G7IU06_MEDTR|nr:peroxidase 51 [Medicago truncatula]AES94579.1 peroxidase family protein [Medicago truncatula]RHN53948.1 putative peroxidase [Medicago truncatula]